MARTKQTARLRTFTVFEKIAGRRINQWTVQKANDKTDAEYQEWLKKKGGVAKGTSVCYDVMIIRIIIL